MRHALVVAVIAFMIREFLPSAAAAEQNALWGTWELESISIAIAEECRGMLFQFTEQGTYQGNDGSMVMNMTYRLVEGARGDVIHFKYVSDNDRPNCQGMPPRFVRENAVRAALVKFTDDPDRMQLYFGATEDWPWMMLVRRK